MYKIIIVLIVIIFLIIYNKRCNNKYQFYKILLFIGIIPFIYNFITSIVSAKLGFYLFDIEYYGLKAFTTHFEIRCLEYFYIFIPSGIAIIISIKNIKKIKRNNKKV